MNKHYFGFFTVLLITHAIVFFECKSNSEDKIIVIEKAVEKVANNTKTPPKREGENRPIPFPFPLPIPTPKPDGPPPRPPITEEENATHMIVDGQKLFMTEDLKGRLRWVPEGQEQNFIY